jgi:hypothetical protein
VRHPVYVEVEITDLRSGFQIKERTKDLSLHGCGVSTAAPFAAGTKVMLKVTYRGREIVVFGQVMYGRRDIGMGIALTMVEPHDQNHLEDWFVN